ncbi:MULTISPECIES: DUF6088 family protein [unclassified Rhizobium]|uniref:DUF6088 family protein n=1 Tax=unclassified Rhizobium TaxID=2613769 RepID=UPI001ADCE490|nr:MULTISPECIES: DUF6088 family protein [unclassified Rhizobium]MBO9101743.1 hypothetical protein [Rhizobium sp. L58/93]QXZ87176.1 hypothetical protein J5287_21655 [Rhizobium sp. K1/93]QXZ92791.1 hypothetical protein J5280_19240 [Rhizobium sp. K15/93]QYA03990.1 hypothetical protein J5278_24855 [Rhizobium sp. B21/90]
MTKLQTLKKHLRAGKVYRREDLVQWSSSIDRHLQQLLAEGYLTKLSTGIYHRPKQTAFGKAPAVDNALVEAFLKDDRYLVTSPNVYNSLGVGATQLYNRTVVYNHKRHGTFTLGGREFEFRKKPALPKTLTREFLLVDLVNNLDQLGEDSERVLARVKERALQGNRSALARAVKQFGMVRTRKFFNGLGADTHAG